MRRVSEQVYNWWGQIEPCVIMAEHQVMDNQQLAQQLRKHATDLDRAGGNLYRVRAYRQAAQMILALEEPVAAIVERTGRRGLRQLPGIGSHIALIIEGLLQRVAA